MGKDGCYDENDNKKSETFESSFSTTESESEFFFNIFTICLFILWIVVNFRASSAIVTNISLFRKNQVACFANDDDSSDDDDQAYCIIHTERDHTIWKLAHN